LPIFFPISYICTSFCCKLTVGSSLQIASMVIKIQQYAPSLKGLLAAEFAVQQVYKAVTA